jgi:hypothetical protein
MHHSLVRSTRPCSSSAAATATTVDMAVPSADTDTSSWSGSSFCSSRSNATRSGRLQHSGHALTRVVMLSWPSETAALSACSSYLCLSDVSLHGLLGRHQDLVPASSSDCCQVARLRATTRSRCRPLGQTSGMPLLPYALGCCRARSCWTCGRQLQHIWCPAAYIRTYPGTWESPAASRTPLSLMAPLLVRPPGSLARDTI